MSRRTDARRFLIPEVLQSSLMDCGPAVLQAVLRGFGIRADYDALRERCGTDVGGTSVDSLAALGRKLGLRTEQVLISRDSFLLPESDSLPAVAVTRTGGGLLHFAVVWRRVGPLVQVMDPAAGRRWLAAGELLSRMPDLPIAISSRRWRAWAATENGLAPLRARLRRLGVQGAGAAALIERAERDSSWLGFAALDAAVRMVGTLLHARSVRRGAQAQRLLRSLLEDARASGAAPERGIPGRFWWVKPAAAEGKLLAHGAVIVHFERPAASGGEPAQTLAEAPEPRRESRAAERPAAGVRAAPRAGRAPRERFSPERVLPAAVAQTLHESSGAPLRSLWQLLCWDSPHALGMLGGALACSAAMTAGEAVLFRGIWQLGAQLSLSYQRAAALLALLAFALCALLLEAFIGSGTRRLGARLELRLRAALLEKLPRLEDRYLRTRSIWDLASRAHALHLLRDAPALVTQLVRAAFTLCTTSAGIFWLHPRGAPWLAAGTLLAFAIPWLFHGPLADGVMRLRSRTAALDRLYLDALLGATAVRAHGGERAVQREHEDLLVDWSQTAGAVHAQSGLLQAAQLAVATASAIGLVASYVHGGTDLSGLILLAYWSVRMGLLTQESVGLLHAMHNLRAVALRLLSPLGARSSEDAPERRAPERRGHGGVSIDLHGITAHAGGRAILSGVSAQIAAGAHVAIVGASGAGKSSLLGLLLGWLDPEQGSVAIDGEPLDASGLQRLRAQTAWIDPVVMLWDRSLYDNIGFGAPADRLGELARAVEGADLTELIDQLPQGLASELGEGGARLSGGQAQRVRLARAMLRPDARLVLLDEAFRGLDRECRRELLARARRHWANATLLFVSHDVGDTQGFDRVLVLEDGRLVEDDAPDSLLARPASLYRRLVQADRELRPHTWWAPGWRRARLEAGRLAAAELP